MKTLFFTSITLFAFTLPYRQTFTFKSVDLGQFANGLVAGNFGCNGLNKTPGPDRQNAPAGTKSVTIIIYDMDAPSGSGCGGA